MVSENLTSLAESTKEKNDRADNTKIVKQYQSFLEAALMKYSIL
jgi:hypothetical protein